MATSHNHERISILGAGNIGTCIADGLANSDIFKAEHITLTRRDLKHLEPYKEKGFNITSENVEAVKGADIIIIAVEPHQVPGIVEEIDSVLDPEQHLVMSVAASVQIAAIRKHLSKPVPVIRCMPNTAIAIHESMTCLSSDSEGEDRVHIERAQKIFETVGETMVLNEEQMIPATALGACGIAFYLRMIRAASQGGIETGLSAKQAMRMAAQTARGASTLLLELENHPEHEIDKVTTPLGCTIAGLNELEHKGLSSAIIQGIKKSADTAVGLYKEEEE